MGDEFDGLGEILKIGARAVAQLIKILQEDEDALSRTRAAIALGRIGDKRAIRPLLGMLKEIDPVLRYTAADALGAIGDKEALPALTALLRDEDPSVRRSAVVALGKLGDKRSVGDLQGVLKAEKHEFVKKKAEEALKAIG